MRTRLAQALRTVAVLLLLAPAALRGQGGSVAGVVVNRASGEPLADAQVAVAGTALRALSDAGGRFRLSDVPGPSAVLRVRLIGYRTVEDTVSVGDTNVRIALEQKALELSQVVVTGTPEATAKSALGNAVGQVDVRDVIAKGAPVTGVQELLNGRVAGVLIQPATGAVGSGARIRIRGTSSLSLSNQPLIYVDGVRVDGDFASGPQNQDFGSSTISRFNDFNPDDIESIEVVRGPAASTLYGTEASNGVIQIITKRGGAGPARWNFTVRQGATFLRNPQGLFPTNYQVSGGNIVSINIRQLEDSVGPLFRTGHRQDYQVSVSGGSELVRYYAAGGTELQGGAEPSNDRRLTSGRANLTISPSGKVTLSANVGYVTGPTHVSCEAGCGGRVWTTVLANPLNLSDPLRKGFHSGLPAEYDELYHFGQALDRFTASTQLQHAPVKWFSHRVTFGVDLTREQNTLYQPRIDSLVLHPTFGSDALGYIAITGRRVENTTLDYAATATVELSPALRSSSSVGAQFYHTLTDTTFADGQFFPAPGLSALDATTGPRTAFGGLEETKSLGFYGQEQVAWRDRVFVTAGLRADDHSTFGANFNRVYYPKVSASWVISDEPFWRYRFVNQLRLRAAYGQSGKAPPTNAAVRTYAPATGPNDATAVTPQNIGNPDLSPERGKEIELGFDAGFWRDRFGLEFTYYHKKTVDEILQREIPPSIGFSGFQYINAGAVLNQGVELLARVRPYDRDPVSVDLTVNVATNSNKIQSLLPGVTSVSPGTFLEHRVGYPVGSWFHKRVVSAQFDSATGTAINVMCDDGAGGAVACANAPNVFLGRTTPKVEGAVGSTVTLWNRLRVYGLLDFKTGYRKLDGNTRVRCTFFGGRCRENFFPLEFDATRIAAVQSNRSLVDFLIDDASFLKLREVSLAYTLPDRWTRAIRATRASVSLAGRNLHTWTRYKGLEPEAMFLGGSRGGNFSAWEQTTLPQLTQWVVTVNLGY